MSIFKRCAIEPHNGWNRSIAEMSRDEIAREKRTIYKNVVLISFAFFCNFTSYGGLSRLQSSLHIDEGMGVINQSILYAALVLSCFFVPTALIEKIGQKWSVTLSFIGYIVWMVANGYAVWATMVPASMIVGLCAAPLWTAQCSYFSQMSKRFADLTDEKPEVIITRFFGIFFCFFQMAGISGSIISATVLNSTPVNVTTADEPLEDDLRFCGIQDCPSNNLSNPNFQEVEAGVLWTMVITYAIIAIIAVAITAIFVDNIPKRVPENKDDQRSVKQRTLDLFMATFKHWRHQELLLLIPLTVYSGLEQTFYGAEFSKSFISCSTGIWMVGVITIPFGVVNASVSLLSAWLVKHTGRIPIFSAALLVDLAIQMTLLRWMPIPSEEYVLFILSSMWGFTDAIWQTQINSLYGILFKNESEAAYSNYRMWESLGFIIAFAYSSYLCTSIKLYILTSLLCISMIGYYVVEFLHRQKCSVQPTKKQEFEL